MKRGQGKFCSRSCAAISTNRSRKPTGKLVNCFCCGKSIYRIQRDILNSKSGNFFCDRKCKRKSETVGNTKRKSMGSNRRAHLKRKADLIEDFGIVCSVKDCRLDLMNDRKLIDLHHYEHPLDHNKTVLLCPYHHRLADNSYQLKLTD